MIQLLKFICTKSEFKYLKGFCYALACMLSWLKYRFTTPLIKRLSDSLNTFTQFEVEQNIVETHQ